MPNIENLEKKPLSNERLSVHRKDILYREDITTSF